MNISFKLIASVLLAACGALSGVQVLAQAPGKRIALLVGVGQYQAFKGAAHGNLEGPPNDVASMRSVLSRRLGVVDANIHSLVNEQATRTNILSELKALKARTAAGDQIIVYLSGHGTSRLDADPDKPFTASLPYSTGAFVTHEFSADRPEEGLIVGRTDLQPIIRDLEAGGRSLWVISDSCFSGQQVRSIAAVQADKLPSRFIPARFSEKQNSITQNSGVRVAPEPYPYQKTIFFAASAEGETAADIPTSHLAVKPTVDGKPHGAFTDALLRVLEGELFADYDSNGMLDYGEILAAVTQFTSARGYGQTPQRLPSVSEDVNHLASRQLVKIAGVGSATKPAATAPLLISSADLPPSLAQLVRNIGGIEIVPLNHKSPDLLLGESNNPEHLVLRTAAGDKITGFSKASPPRELVGLFTQFAWAKRMRSLGELGRRGLLQAEISPSQYGGNFLLGERIQFVVQPDRASHLLLVNIDALGKVSVLYPATPEELAALPANKPTTIPAGQLSSAGIVVVEPLGMDMQLLFSFDRSLPELQRFSSLRNVSAGDARLRELEQLLTKEVAKFTMASTELRVLAKPGS